MQLFGVLRFTAYDLEFAVCGLLMIPTFPLPLPLTLPLSLPSAFLIIVLFLILFLILFLFPPLPLPLSLPIPFRIHYPHQTQSLTGHSEISIAVITRPDYFFKLLNSHLAPAYL